MTVKIFHNEACGTSRNVLALIRHLGIEPTIIDYLTAPPTIEQLRTMIADAGLSVRDALRSKEPIASTLGLDDASIGDEDLLRAMVDNPILINRPFVITEKGTCLARPSERALQILPDQATGPFFKEDGEMILGLDGTRPTE
jgi:arsenate reductase